jgi:hypothetical protein
MQFQGQMESMGESLRLIEETKLRQDKYVQSIEMRNREVEQDS